MTSEDALAEAPRAGASVRAVFFDLYGTLIDIRTDENDSRVYETMAEYLAYLGVRITPQDLQQEYRRRVREALDRSLEAHPDVDVYDVFRGLLTAHRDPAGPAEGRAGADPWAVATAALFRTLTRRAFAVMPGALEALGTLRTAYRLGVISDAQWVFTDAEIRMAGLGEFFPVVVLSSRVGVRKPNARIFTEALDTLGVAAEESVYVGDNPERDLVGARAAGMRCVLFRPPGAGPDGLTPDASFHDYAALASILEALA